MNSVFAPDGWHPLERGHVDHHGEVAFCVETDVGEGAGQARQAEIFNIDRARSRAPLFTGLLIKNGIAISMDGMARQRLR